VTEAGFPVSEFVRRRGPREAGYAAVSYPTVRAVVRRTRAAPAVPVTEHRLTIRLRGDEFMVVDADGRSFGELIAEATSARAGSGCCRARSRI
jgi:hypothetical protein